MRRLPVQALLGIGAALVLGATAIVASGADEKVLINVRGDVSYVTFPDGQSHPLAPGARMPLEDDDTARTGPQTQGAIVLPDSSRVIMASNTAVKLDAFNTVDSSAHFVVAQGKLRFRIEHPQGARANYTFTTPTGNIAVRGTEGDISVDAFDGVRVNVYHLSAPDLPVKVDMYNGETFQIPAGQKIWMRWQSGKLVGKVLPLTQAEIDRFSELGPPETVDTASPAP